MVPGEGQSTPQQEAIAGAGAATNPWAEYGLNPDGTPIEAPKRESGEGRPAGDETAALKAKLSALEAQIAKLPDSFAGMNKKLDLIDRVAKAVMGEQGGADDGLQRQVWSDLKEVAKRAAPEAYKLFDLLEKQPGALDQLTNQVSSLQASHVIGLNEKAHDRVVELAKKAGFKGGTTDELNEMVFPFEQSMTMMINSNPELRRAFLSGNMNVVDDIFNRMIKPHVAQRLREKQARMKTTVPSAVPRGAGQPSGQGEERKASRDLTNPKGRADFHKNAVARWLDKVATRNEE